MQHYFILWAIHVLGWFLLSYAFSVVRGRLNALKLMNAVAIGTVSFIFQLLVDTYMKGHP